MNIEFTEVSWFKQKSSLFQVSLMSSLCLLISFYLHFFHFLIKVFIALMSFNKFSCLLLLFCFLFILLDFLFFALLYLFLQLLQLLLFLLTLLFLRFLFIMLFPLLLSTLEPIYSILEFLFALNLTLDKSSCFGDLSLAGPTC